MLPIYLTAQELQGITGFVKASAQVRSLRQMGFQFVLRADGSPLVSRTHFEKLLGGAGLLPPPSAAAEPDYSSLQ